MQIRKLWILLFVLLIGCSGCQSQEHKETQTNQSSLYQVKMKCRNFTCRYYRTY